MNLRSQESKKNQEGGTAMEWKKIVTIIRRDKLRDVEECLKDLRVNGISVTRGKGYGEYANFFHRTGA
jgi:nitrogen regulatory protein P-II 1